ncbi:MAG: hypothetical protein WCS55_02670, partial [Sulfuricurvum sp.]|uniref:hypothetical protein n=1 Tax=Sulfuricurvum sp. TaxID=2025608 RepID=UPI0035644FE2
NCAIIAKEGFLFFLAENNDGALYFSFHRKVSKEIALRQIASGRFTLLRATLLCVVSQGSSTRSHASVLGSWYALFRETFCFAKALRLFWYFSAKQKST